MVAVAPAILVGSVPDFIGSGYGSGYGYGSGDGSKQYWSATVPWFAGKWPQAQRDRLAALQAEGATIAFWRSCEDGTSANGGHGTPAYPGKVEEVKGPLQLCSHRALHATMLPPKWKGPRWWIVALIGEVKHEDDKCGALRREIIGECL